MEMYRDCDHGAASCRQITKAIITFEAVKTENRESMHNHGGAGRYQSRDNARWKRLSLTGG